MLLRRAGFGTVDLVEDGQAAVNYCQALSADQQPSIIFMDNTMPKLVSCGLNDKGLCAFLCLTFVHVLKQSDCTFPHPTPMTNSVPL